ncbi:MAG: 2-hydroxyacyl-CoA dehydratase [Phycisphaerae bacterium]
MTVEDMVQDCRDVAELLPDEAVALARERHPDVSGFGVFPVYAPFEIIHAAGLLPVGLFGAGNRLEISHADSRFQSFICSIAKSTLELFLADKMTAFSGVVFSSICDVARNLASLVERNTEGLYVEYLHLPQHAHCAASIAYTRAEFERFRRKLSAHLGRPITDDAIRSSVGVYNKVRRLIRTLYRERTARPGCLAASELCAVVRAGTSMMPEDFVGVLEPLIDLVRKRSVHPMDTVDVVVEGAFCEQPPLGLVDVIEAAGCSIKDDDMMVGWRLFSEDVDLGAAPIDALADAYRVSSVYTSVRHNAQRPRTDALVERMKASRADAVVFAPAKFCEPALLDYVLYRRKLEASGIPHIKLEFEEKMWAFDTARTEMETFAESMLFD